jgi:hypothetical protein
MNDDNERNKPSGQRTVCLDFDGVIHKYTSGWLGPDNIPDGPVPGISCAIDILRKKHGYEVKVYSSRCRWIEGMRAIVAALKAWGIEVDDVVHHKPAAIAYVDDRGVTFNGDPLAMVDAVVKMDKEGPWYASK